jgi:hypothetical protein
MTYDLSSARQVDRHSGGARVQRVAHLAPQVSLASRPDRLPPLLRRDVFRPGGDPALLWRHKALSAQGRMFSPSLPSPSLCLVQLADIDVLDGGTCSQHSDR